MNIALISDIHGNLVALEAVLAALERHAPDQIVCLGDVAANGPQTTACLDRVRALGCPVVMGNTDKDLIERFGASEETGFWPDIMRWNAQQLNHDHRGFINHFQPTVEVALSEGKTLLCFHGSPKSFDDIIRATTPDEELDPMLDGHPADVLAGGHTHTVMLRRWRGSLMVNPGSVGLPFEDHPDRGKRNPPWAEYALVRQAYGQINVAFERAALDVDAVVQSALDTEMPHAQQWAQNWG